MTYDIVIVGSGPAGAAAALGLSEHNIKPAMLDVGYEPENIKQIEGNFYDFRKNNPTFDIMIGNNYEGLFNILTNKPNLVKLIPPMMKYITKDTEVLSPLRGNGFRGIQSFALGGLANAWGAGLYRYKDYELKNLPVKETELALFYDKLTREIGISGENDDLTPFFGSTEYLLKPLNLSSKASQLLLTYTKHKKKFNETGLFLGKPRLGILSENYNDRNGCNYNNLEFWQPNLSHIYTPAFTIKKLIKEDKIIYHKRILVKSWARENDYIIVNAINTDDNSHLSFKCKKLILAAGPLNTARIILGSKKDFDTELQLLDNPAIQFPLVFPSFIGKKIEKDAFGLTQLNLCFNSPKNDLLLQGSFLEITSPARAEFYSHFPLSAKANLNMISMFLPAMLVFQLFFPADNKTSHRLKLNKNHELEAFANPYNVNKNLINEFARYLRMFNVFTHSSIITYPPPGHGVHYAGTIPMVNNPANSYECSKFGELFKEPDIYIVDGSLFPYLPAKNYSFTVMANSMRIADYISKRILSE